MLDQATGSGEILQVGFDYFALDEDGNVWILGGYTEDCNDSRRYATVWLM